MSRAARLTFAALVLALVLATLGIARPGLPLAPRGDEPTYLLAALSLAEDGDLVCTRADLERLFQVFPFAHEPTLELVARSAGPPVFAVPLPYPLLAAPFARLIGDRGPLLANALLLTLCLGLATAYLRRYNAGATALLFAAGFFLAGLTLPAVFWIHPEVLATTLVLATLYLGLPPADGARDGGGRGVGWRVAGSGVALGLAVHLLAPLALLALPILASWLRRRRPAWAVLWLAAAVTAGLLIAGWSLRLTEQPRPAAAEERFTVRVADPLTPLAAPAPSSSPAASLPAEPGAVLRTAGYLLAGRHVGLLPYFPFVLVTLIFFLLHHRRDPERWLLFASIAGIVVLFAVDLARVPVMPSADRADVVSRLLALPGNGLLLALSPAFLLLVTRLAPRGLVVAGWALAGLTITPLLFTPFGAPVAQATIQTHVRGLPYALWPLELAWLPRLPDYAVFETVDGPLYHRRDETVIRGDRLGVFGGLTTEAWLARDRPLPEVRLVIESPAPDNEVRVALADASAELLLRDTPADGGRETLRLAPTAPTAVLTTRGGAYQLYRLRIATTRGARPRWRGRGRRADYLGAELAYLGTETYLGRDLYAVAWTVCGAPAQAHAGEVLRVLVELRNESDHPWPARGAARVRLGSRWRDSRGEVAAESTRTDLDRRVEPGESLIQWQRVRAPARPGRYVLELEPLFEGVAWFGSRTDDAACRTDVEVLPDKPGDG